MRTIIEGIKNILYWLPVIWRDRWYSWEYILDILVHKLRDTEKRTREDGCHLYSYQDADQIAQVIRMLTDVRDDVYFDRAIRKSDETVGKMVMFDTPIDDNLRELHSRYPNKPEGMTDDEARKISVSWTRKADERRWSDLRKAMSLMGKNLPLWWD